MKQGERESLLIKMQIDNAREAQYQHGIEKYGEAGDWRNKGNFVGDPLAHLFTELIDAMNYAEVAFGKGQLNSARYGYVYFTLRGLAIDVQQIAARNFKSKEDV